ncbi:MAG: ATP phosphoribosyltransferase [Calditrichaeota bacterium]|nr:ATP phosphoribosyltransferase [Calditrichota bacterium]
MLTNGRLKIAIQKNGRLSEESHALLRGIGLDYDTRSRQLFALCRKLPVEIIFLRDDDIPEYVQDGICQLGIVGQNQVAETSADVDERLQLDFGKCRLSLAVKTDSSYSYVADLNGKKIATSYPTILRSYLAKENCDAELITINGSVEVCPALGVADAIADLVSTGTTLKNNQLRVIADIFKSQSVLISSRRNLNANQSQLIEKLVCRIKAYTNAQSSKYIMMNVKKQQLSTILKLLPSLQAPTIVPLGDEKSVAVHSVISRRDTWELAENLQANGASGILITNIEKLLP